MPFCQNCGKELKENEVCSCSSQQTAPPPVNNTPKDQPPPPANTQMKFQQYDQLGRPMYTAQGYLITYDDNGTAHVEGQKKNSSGCLVAALIIFFVCLVVGGILAAILVPSMLGFVKKSKLSSAAADAKSVCIAANCALTEMEEEGNLYHKGYTIIRSSAKMPEVSNLDPSYKESDGVKNGIDSEELKNIMSYYREDIDYDWFVVIHDGVVEYAASKTNNNKYVGVYPQTSTTDVQTYSGRTIHECQSIDELYDDAAAAVKSKSFISYFDNNNIE